VEAKKLWMQAKKAGALASCQQDNKGSSDPCQTAPGSGPQMPGKA
jgi:hypothetical protein